MYGSVEFYKAPKDVELNQSLAVNATFVKNVEEKNKERKYTIYLLAKDETGRQNLQRISL